MALLNTIADDAPTGSYHSQHVTNFIKKIRSECPITLPALADNSKVLNGCWALKQHALLKVLDDIRQMPCSWPGCTSKHDGATNYRRLGDIFSGRICQKHVLQVRQEDPVWLARGKCKWCGIERGVRVVPYRGSGEDSECSSCYIWMDNHPGEGTRPVAGILIGHPVAEGCGNCGPEEKDASRWHRSGADRRCGPCYNYLLKTGVEREAVLPVLLEGCGNCGEPEPEGSAKGWAGIGKDRRCNTYYKATWAVD